MFAVRFFTAAITFLLFAGSSAYATDLAVIDSTSSRTYGCLADPNRGYAFDVGFHTALSRIDLFSQDSRTNISDHVKIYRLDKSTLPTLSLTQVGTFVLETATLTNEISPPELNTGSSSGDLGSRPVYKHTYSGSILVLADPLFSYYFLPSNALVGGCYVLAPSLITIQGFQPVVDNTNGWVGTASLKYNLYVDNWTGDVIAPVVQVDTRTSITENTSFVQNILSNESSTISLASGGDFNHFVIETVDSRTAILKFRSNADFENPADEGLDNVYEVTLLVSDAAQNVSPYPLAITVTDVLDTTSILSYSFSSSPKKGVPVNITAVTNVASKVSFSVNSKRISGCQKLATLSSGTFSVTCRWKPSVRGSNQLKFSVYPNSQSLPVLHTNFFAVNVSARTGTR